MVKTIGILGGMGSYAAVDFFKTILDQFDVTHESDYPKILISNNPKIPSRTRAILYNEASPLPGMVDGCNTLHKAGADFVAIDCNSAHAWYDELVQQVKIPVINMIEVVKNNVIAQNPVLKKIGLISGEVAIKTGIYNQKFEPHNIKILLTDDETQKKVRTIIDDVKHNKVTSQTKQHALEMLDYFKQQGAEGVILGCTEIPLVLNQKDSELPLFDCTAILARHVAELSEEPHIKKI